MDQRDYEALHCILERNGRREIIRVLDEIWLEGMIASLIEEGMSKDEATTYANEIAERQ